MLCYVNKFQKVLPVPQKDVSSDKEVGEEVLLSTGGGYRQSQINCS